MAHPCVILFCANAFLSLIFIFFLALSSLRQKSVGMTFFITFQGVMSQASNIGRFCVAFRLHHLCPKTLCLRSTKKQAVDCLPPLPRSPKPSPTLFACHQPEWRTQGLRQGGAKPDACLAKRDAAGELTECQAHKMAPRIKKPWHVCPCHAIFTNYLINSLGNSWITWAKSVIFAMEDGLVLRKRQGNTFSLMKATSLIF